MLKKNVILSEIANERQKICMLSKIKNLEISIFGLYDLLFVSMLKINVILGKIAYVR